MKTTLLFLTTAFCLSAWGPMASASDVNTGSEYQDTEIEILVGEEEEQMMQSLWRNPPGSTWISVRCGRNSTCYPPAGYKYRHFNLDLRGSDCRGRYKRQVKQTKDYIRTSRKCSAVGRVFIIPAESCRGNHRFCS